MEGYKGVECQDLEKDNFIDNRQDKFEDVRYKSMCFLCNRNCKVRITDKFMHVIECNAFIPEFNEKLFRKIKMPSGLIKEVVED